MNNNGNHLLDILTGIYNLQTMATNGLDGNNSCTRPMLGLNNNFNTRPVTFYLCNNTELSIQYPTGGDPATANSTTFRVEGINSSCVTVRLLAAGTDGTFTSTGQFATVNIDCIAAIRCLADTLIAL